MQKARILILFTMLAAVSARAEEPAPKIVCDEPKFDFGSVQDVDDIRHAFVLRNAGDAELVISHVRASCGCTTPGWVSNTVAPGKSVDLPTVLSLKGRTGDQHKVITIDSNDPVSPQYRVELIGKVQRLVEIVPAQALIELRSGQAPRQAEVRITFNTPEPHAITGIDTAGAEFATVTLRANRPGFDYTLVVDLDTNAVSQVQHGNLVLTTDFPSQPSLRIPVVVSKVQNVVVAPNQLAVPSNLAPESPMVQQILVRNRDPGPMEILEILTPTTNVQAVVNKLAEYMYRVEVTVRQPLDGLDGQKIAVRVKRQGAEEETYDIPIKVVGR